MLQHIVVVVAIIAAAFSIACVARWVSVHATLVRLASQGRVAWLPLNGEQLIAERLQLREWR